MVAQNVGRMVPTMEVGPVVASYQQDKLMLRIVLSQMLQRVPRVRRLGQLELVVACHDTFLTLQRQLCHLQPQTVVEQVGRALLQRVLRRHHQPHLVELRQLA